MGIENTGVIAEQIYGSIKDQIRVHLLRVTRCPADFPAQDNLSVGQPDHVDGLHEIDNKQIIEEDDKKIEELVPSRTRTRIVKPPTRYQC